LSLIATFDHQHKNVFTNNNSSWYNVEPGFRNGDIAKTVARSLSGFGFNSTWVVTDGFDGGRGWVQSRLGTESSGTSFTEILSPSRVISGTKFLQAGSD
jgi:hypothetical protein